MPHFIEHSNKYIISTSYKCGFSKLNSLNYLRRISSRKLALKLIKNPLLFSKHYFIYRDPYKRLQSLFLDKFRQCIKSEIIQSRFHLGILDYLEVGLEDNNHIKEVFLGITFQEFIISILPNIYMVDQHTWPQVKMIKVYLIRRFKIEIPIKTRGFDLDDAKSVDKLSQKTKIDFSQKLNSTKFISEDCTWTPEMRKVVNKIYQEDFKRFRIKQITTENE